MGSKERANKLRWSLREALRERDTTFVVHGAHCLWIGLARDAKQRGLLFRFRAVGFHKRHLTVRAGISGHDKGAANIVLATNHVLGRFLTTGLNKARERRWPERNAQQQSQRTTDHGASFSRAPTPTPMPN